jgi:hypothetical protein
MMDLTSHSEFREFEAFHRAFKTLSQSNAFHYDLGGNFIYSPSETINIDDAFDLLHEYVHSQVGNSILGMVLQTLAECCSILEKFLFAEMRGSLECLNSHGNDEAYRELYLFGSVRSRSVSYQERVRIQHAVKGVWKSTRISSLASAFERLRGRFVKLCKAWELIHEAAAVSTSINATSSFVRSNEYLERFYQSCGLRDLDSTSQSIDRTARQSKARYDRDLAVSRMYSEARRLGDKAIKVGGIEALWAAVLAAGHFDYCSCNIVDMNDHDFDIWINDVGFTNRFRRILEQETELVNATEQIFNSGNIDNTTMIAILDVARGKKRTQSMNSIENFWEWEKTRIWNSDLMKLVGPIDFQGADLFENTDKYDDGKVDDFRIPENWIPTVITSKPQILFSEQDEARRTMRRFIQCYEVKRTISLIDYLRSLSSDV